MRRKRRRLAAHTARQHHRRLHNGTAVRLITIAMRVSIAAEVGRVWSALTDPNELISWDSSLLSAIDPLAGYPSCDRVMRWRYRLKGVQVVLHDRPREIVPLKKLHSTMSMGSLRYEQTYSLASENVDSEAKPMTQLGLKLIAANAVPVLGATIDRFEMRRLATERVDEMMRGIQRWCEKDVSDRTRRVDRSKSPSADGKPSRQTSTSR